VNKVLFPSAPPEKQPIPVHLHRHRRDGHTYSLSIVPCIQWRNRASAKTRSISLRRRRMTDRTSSCATPPGDSIAGIRVSPKQGLTIFSLLGRCARLSCSPAPARQGGLRSQARPSSAPHTPASFSVRTSVFSFLGEYRAGRDEGAQAVHRPVAPCFGSSLFRNAEMPHGAVIAQAHYIINSSRGMSVTIIDIGNAPALVIRVLPQTASSLH
jgi:hypothetical protein